MGSAAARPGQDFRQVGEAAVCPVACWPTTSVTCGAGTSRSRGRLWGGPWQGGFGPTETRSPAPPTQRDEDEGRPRRHDHEDAPSKRVPPTTNTPRRQARRSQRSPSRCIPSPGLRLFQSDMVTGRPGGRLRTGWPFLPPRWKLPPTLEIVRSRRAWTSRLGMRNPEKTSKAGESQTIRATCTTFRTKASGGGL